MQSPDRELVARFVATGDEEAFRLLFRRHSPRLHGLVTRLLGRRAVEADDVLQDAWIRAAARLGAFEWRSELSTWLAGIAVNCVRERLRVRLGEPLDALADDPPSIDVSRERIIDLERAIAALPDGYREVLVLHDVEGLTHEEIGTLLHLSDGTSKSQLSRARRALRVRLAGRAKE